MFYKNDLVVMHTCEESQNEKYAGKIWIVESDEEIINGYNVVKLKNYPHKFNSEYLQKISREINNNFIEISNVFDLLNELQKELHNLMPLMLGDSPYYTKGYGKALQHMFDKLNKEKNKPRIFINPLKDNLFNIEVYREKEGWTYLKIDNHIDFSIAELNFFIKELNDETKFENFEEFIRDYL